MWRVVLVLLIILSGAADADGQTGQRLRITHGPWLQNLTEDGVTVMWTTNLPAVPAVLVSTDGINFRSAQNSTDGMINAGDTLHKVRIDGLVPGKHYFYKLYTRSIDVFQPYKISYGDTLVSERWGFQTINPEAGQTSFLVLNDVHGNAGKMAGYLENSELEETDVFFFNGDMIDYFQERSQIFNGFLDTAVFYFAKRVPFVYVRGNHEARGRLARQFKDYFDFADDRFYGSFRMGPVQFLILDCGEDKPDDNQYYFQLADYDQYRLRQLAWLQREIEKPGFKSAPFRVVIVHMPVVKGSDQWHGMKFLADHFGPVLASAGIDLMISGHTHKFGYLSGNEAGFGYPVVVASNNNFIEAVADTFSISLAVKDTEGKEVYRTNIGRQKTLNTAGSSQQGNNRQN
jgi:acid phosphatase type 7